MENNNNNGTLKENVIGEKANHRTYFKMGDEETGIMEIDLVTARQKNEEIRYLGINFSGKDIKTGTPQEAYFNIDNEEAFDELKKFFIQLEWNS